jgi:hypothetical protein
VRRLRAQGPGAEAVWKSLTDFESWSRWKLDDGSPPWEGTVAEGSRLRRKARRPTVSAFIERVDAPRVLAWTSKTFGAKTIHFYWIEPHDHDTVVRAEESCEGLMVNLLGAWRKGKRRSGSAEANAKTINRLTVELKAVKAKAGGLNPKSALWGKESRFGRRRVYW